MLRNVVQMGLEIFASRMPEIVLYAQQEIGGCQVYRQDFFQGESPFLGNVL